ncbi:MAG: hypothetical protein A2942_03410 [Candidatus Lloydbacteria bacterium RIFCSPLOWO2_01_FULL_50_20]|uniref:Uncharacterized protein n=1 Tax=Candidatus Lloydbacteria bacterium RIFCSPLOWO2_01_FULL_50_20 TaxID=1798665 RepID=A0A1G2DDV3_9BACT|nr:MAG: hypothetical protein A3C13_03275 [Candidatus Lloydbacteria bacterium RIFCSPHIGHO2_02_FULL_50_11]OGZ11030.1 MAG: hypothetical protein A2942_03410 [Candidatus Lloydbacteria bacterium RIFCSPLOWO2_01_FULL_50_20]
MFTIVFAAFFSSILSAPAVFAADDTLGGSKKLHASTQAETRSSEGQPVRSRVEMLMKGIVIDRHTTSFYRYWQRQDTRYKEEFQWGDAVCRSVIIHGKSDYACDDPVWKKLAIGTVISVPAGLIFAKASPGNPPEAVALSRTREGEYVLDIHATIVTVEEIRLALQLSALTRELSQKSSLVNFLGIATVAFLLLFVLMVALYVDCRRKVKDRDRTIAEMIVRLDKLRQSIPKA